MRVVVGTVDGKFHYSKNFTYAELQKNIDEAGGNVYEGDLAYKNRPDLTAEQMLDDMLELLKYDKRNNYQVFSIDTEEGQVGINVRHVVWWTLKKEDE